MTSFVPLIKEARDCHTKIAWSSFFEKYEDEISSTTDSKLLEEVYKALSQDPQGFRYPEEFWTVILKGCLSSWDLNLGRKISHDLKTIPSAAIAILSSEIFIQSGSPLTARQVANRALRLTTIKSWERLQLQMIVCNSYVEEGKNTMALRLLSKMETAVITENLNRHKKADLLINMARARFFLGSYTEAAQVFYAAYETYLELENWECAAKGLFNASACYHNSGQENQSKAFALVSQCKELAEEHGLEGALSHCYAFFATDDHQRGNFTESAQNYRKAIDHLPMSESSFRRLHVLSMLAFTYLKMGRFQDANKFGQQTLELASLDQSERFRSRYINLKAEMLWYEGQVEESQDLLRESTTQLFTNGVNTLEELSAVSRYYLQASQLNIGNLPIKVKIADQLKNNTVSWVEYLYARSQIYLTRRRLTDAWKTAKTCTEIASDYGAKYYEALGILTLLQIKLTQHQFDDEFDHLLSHMKKVSSSLNETPIKIYLTIVKAAYSYHQGRFPEVRTLLGSIARSKQSSVPNQIILNSWIATLDGHSPKINAPWQIQLVARATRVYFAPSLVMIDHHNFRVSNYYVVNLKRHPVLANLLKYLLSDRNFSATAANLQSKVWNQSLSSRGWQQKIRNTIMRMRDSFPHTMAPLILHSDNQIRLFEEAIRLKPLVTSEISIEDEIVQLIDQEPMSTAQLSGKINKSKATIKRTLKKLTESETIIASKAGRQVVYIPNKAEHIH